MRRTVNFCPRLVDPNGTAIPRSSGPNQIDNTHLKVPRGDHVRISEELYDTVTDWELGAGCYGADSRHSGVVTSIA